MADKLTTAEILAQIPAATALAEAERRDGLLATSVRYHRASHRFLVELSNGVLLGVPLASLPELAHATFAQLASVELTPSGAGLRIDALDEDFSVPGIVQAIVGRQIAARAFAQTGGRTTSDAKAAAARANGAKGGRPRQSGVMSATSYLERGGAQPAAVHETLPSGGKYSPKGGKGSRPRPAAEKPGSGKKTGRKKP
jgi:hypothetical protein